MERADFKEWIEPGQLVDRGKLPRGPWDDEPDKVQWTDPATGLPCLIVRNPLGALCGYVGIEDAGHPWFGGDYFEMPADVHGGLTYADHCAGSICHTPDPGRPDHVYWIGFDCSHFGDLTPYMAVDQPERMHHDTYRPLSYVKREVEQLARQVEEAGQRA